jgi:secreted trypsin-like serine protease
MHKFISIGFIFSFVLAACGSSAPVASQPPVTAAPSTAADFAGYYHLQTQFLEDQNKCLEGNQLAADSMVGGAAFMDDCSDATGESWKLVPLGDGYYHLQTQFLEAQNKCLEGNQLAADSMLAGAAFMDDCSDATGESWKLVPLGDGYYHLQTQFLEDQNKCLEGNQLAADSMLAGAAFMDDCSDASGQSWKLVPIQ